MIFNSVIAGTGGGGTVEPVEAKAVGSTTSAVQKDKVLLIPTDIIFDDTLYDCGNNFGYDWYVPPVYPGYVTDYTKVNGWLNRYYVSDEAYFTGYWNSTVSAFSSTSTAGFTVYCPEYLDDEGIAVRLNTGTSARVSVNSLGILQNDVFTPLLTLNYSNERVAFNYINKHFVASNYVGEVNNGSITYRQATDKYSLFVSKLNNDWYYVHNQTVYSLSTGESAFSFSRPWGQYVDESLFYLDDNVDYIAMIGDGSSQQGIYKIDKSSSTWTATLLTQSVSVLNSAIKGGLLTRNNSSSNGNSVFLHSKDFGTYVEIYLTTNEFGYDTYGNGNKVAHFKFDKATDTLTRLADVFYDVDTSTIDYNAVNCVQVNWNLGMISMNVMNFSGSSATKRYAIFVKKFDNLAGVYKYFAFTPEKGNYYPDQSITGFVKSNEGTDGLGNTVLKVNTAEDPDYEWTNIDIVFGMNVTVNEGEP